ncbi:OPT/YSL family transporter [Comamonas sp. JC664]|uniref:OPT/YSL family transporter n=1 Tax=Comamonas sp. JC664 TaxID=2801917 RepID=UPI00174BBAB7|nr:OPT/YSL family transporter [Comamonas sp. JC664]MBL0692225.1 OPT/YSL family transporter [Comamonas sp. JC664]GHG98099.1 oligopeptide transporter, OPT family protein [Comamonas sp. KCTC 72670]
MIPSVRELTEPETSPTDVAPVLTRVQAHTAPLELTARALGMGLLIGGLLAVTNVYMGLKTGWWESGSVTAAVLGFSALATVSRKRGAAYTPLENNLTQTAAASVGAMPAAAGLLGALPALTLLGTSVPAWGVAVWSVALGVLGVLAAHLLRRRLVAQEALPFPTGIATAELITAMHASTGTEARAGRGWLLAGAGAAAVAVTAVRDAFKWLPGMTALPGTLGGVPAASLTWGVGWSPMLLAIGMMTGPRLGLSMLAGAAVAWGVLSPWLAGTGLLAETGYESLSAWLTWPGVGLMVGSAMASLLAQARDFLGAARDLGHLGKGESVPGWAFGVGLGACVLAVGLGSMLFGLSVPYMLLALVLVLPLCAVCARGAGQVDVSPVTQMGQVTQVIFGGLLPGAVAPNVAAGAVVSGAAAQTGVSMWSLKAGHLLGASPRRLLAAQLVGVLAGSVVGVPVYLLLTRTQGLGSEALPAPFAHQFRAVAEVAVRGLDGLPPQAAMAAGVAVGVGALLTFASRGRVARWLPLPVALGIGFILPAYYAVTICVGALGLAAARWRWPAAAERNVSTLAAGAIAGESLAGVLFAALMALGLM